MCSSAGTPPFCYCHCSHQLTWTRGSPRAATAPLQLWDVAVGCQAHQGTAVVVGFLLLHLLPDIPTPMAPTDWKQEEPSPLLLAGTGASGAPGPFLTCSSHRDSNRSTHRFLLPASRDTWGCGRTRGPATGARRNLHTSITQCTAAPCSQSRVQGEAPPNPQVSWGQWWQQLGFPHPSDTHSLPSSRQPRGYSHIWPPSPRV